MKKKETAADKIIICRPDYGIETAEYFANMEEAEATPEPETIEEEAQIIIPEGIELLKAAVLLQKIAEIQGDIKVCDSWEIGYNPNSGFTYAWNEGYLFTLVIDDLYYWNRLPDNALEQVSKWYNLNYNGVEFSENNLGEVNIENLHHSDKEDFIQILKELSREGNEEAAEILEAMETETETAEETETEDEETEDEA
jgi:hypothetical protein